jgi:outer membrane protein assembly factor BamB
VNQAATLDIANEILNDIQRDAGGDTVTEDESRYAVAVRLPGAKDAPVWKGEVIGPPALHPLKTVNVVSSGKGIVVLDQTNKKKWEAALTYPVTGRGSAADDQNESAGLGPCVERGDTLYVFDAGVLSAFDLATGNARWRLPSVGINGLFFDDAGMIYVNTTTASPDKIKYSKQIDVTDQVGNVVLKLDPKNGKILWTSGLAGRINHLSGKFIYTVSSYQADEDEEPNPYLPMASRGSSLNIQRINPKNGKIMWAHPQERAPLDIRFDKNLIHLVFKKEVQVLKFLAF